MLFCIAFLFQFLIAGLTGIMLGVGAVRLAAREFVLRGRAFSLRHRRRHPLRALRRLLLLVPEDVGKDVSETLGRLHFWLFLIGFHLTFDFMHIPGLLGMPRRIYTYEPGPRLGHLESDRHDRRGLSGARRYWSSLATCCGRTSKARAPGAIPGTRGRSNGPPVRRRRPTTSRRFRWSGAAGRCGTSSIRRIRTGSTSSRKRRHERIASDDDRGRI